MKKDFFEKNVVHSITTVFFVISIIICIGAIIFSVVEFIQTYTQLSKDIASINLTISSDFDTIIALLVKNEGNTQEILEQIDLTNTKISSTIEQLQRLQELEYSAISHNTLTFLYTFLSSVLIGVATYCINQCIKYTTTIKASSNQICENQTNVEKLKEIIKTQNTQTISLSFYHCYQTIVSLLDSITNLISGDTNDMQKLLYQYTPRLNTSVQTCYSFVDKLNDSDIQEIKNSEGKRIVFDLNEIIKRIEALPTDKTNLVTIDSKNFLLQKVESTKSFFEE